MYNIIIFSSITVYSVLVYILLTKHRLAIKEQFSYATGKITLKWLLFVSITVYVSFCLTFMSIGINLFVTDVPFEPKLFTYVGLTLFSFAFSFYGYRQVSIYHPKEAVVPNLEVEKSLPKYERSRIEPNDLETIMHRLQLSMQEEKLYLNSELELKDVALHLKVPKHHITQALNSLTAKNFYTFINEFRVQEFIERMKDPDNASFTILSIALDCGFNSKSTFNSVFKRNTGRTPSEFIKKLKT